MCRYSIPCVYKGHYVCLPCRRSIKAEYRREHVPCPECGAPMVAMGRDFHAPRRGSRNQWRKVELLAARGVRFDSCGCRGPGYRPRTFAEAKAAA